MAQCETVVIVINRISENRVRLDVLGSGVVNSVECDDNIDDLWAEGGEALVEAAAKALERV